MQNFCIAPESQSMEIPKKKKSMPYVPPPPFSIPGSATDFMEFRGSSVCGVEYTVVYSTCTLIVMDGVICHDLLDRCQPI